MNIANRLVFQFFALSLLMNWLVLFLLSRNNYDVNWQAILIGLVAGSLPALLPRSGQMAHPKLIKAKAIDRALFLDDLMKATEEAGYIATASFENRIIFRRLLFFPPQELSIEVKSLEDFEVFIKYPRSAAKALEKHLAPYIKLRDVEFLKETDLLMKNEEDGNRA